MTPRGLGAGGKTDRMVLDARLLGDALELGLGLAGLESPLVPDPFFDVVRLYLCSTSVGADLGDLATKLGRFWVGDDQKDLGSLLEDIAVIDVEATLDGPGGGGVHSEASSSSAWRVSFLLLLLIVGIGALQMLLEHCLGLRHVNSRVGLDSIELDGLTRSFESAELEGTRSSLEGYIATGKVFDADVVLASPLGLEDDLLESGVEEVSNNRLLFQRHAEDSIEELGEDIARRLLTAGIAHVARVKANVMEPDVYDHLAGEALLLGKLDLTVDLLINQSNCLLLLLFIKTIISVTPRTTMKPPRYLEPISSSYFLKLTVLLLLDTDESKREHCHLDRSSRSNLL